MIRLSKIDDELSIYKDRDIVLFGAGDAARAMRNELDTLGFPVKYYCDNDEKKWGTYIDGIEVLSYDELIAASDDRTLVQIASKKYDNEIARRMRGGHRVYPLF